MFIKSKLCFTVFVIYEIVAITLLHFQRTCDAMFSTGFCDGDFKYFAGAVAVPLLVYLIWMWIREIVRARRRRHFIERAKHLVGNIATSVHEQLGNISGAEMERILTMAILIGIKKYSDRHPNLRYTIGEIIGIHGGDKMEYEYDVGVNGTNASRSASRRKNVAATGRARSTTKKRK